MAAGDSTASMEPFAVVGFSFKLPQDIVDEASLWDMLQSKKNVMTEWPADRATVDEFHDGGSKKPNTVRSSSVSVYQPNDL